MLGMKQLLLTVTIVTVIRADPSAVDVLQDIYSSCLSSFSVNCVKPKTLSWINAVADKNVIKITDDLAIVKNRNYDDQVERVLQKDILDKFEDFLQTHNVVAQAPAILRPDGPLGKLVPRTFQPDPIQVPLAATGRSKLVKKVIFPFLLGLKFKTAILVPLALTLIALKTWKALTLGLISLVLTGANFVFSKFMKPPAYEVVHYPHYLDHHYDAHHIDVVHPQVVPAAPAIQALPVVPAVGWQHPGYSRVRRSAQEIAYKGYLN